MLKKNECVQAQITDMNNFGFGVAHCDGQVLFVQNGVTGDDALLRVIKLAKTYAVARIDQLLVPSPYRVVAACNAYRSCGGCQYQHISYAYEKTLKEETVRAALRRAGLKLQVAPITGNDQLYAYRNKAQYPVVQGSDGKLRAGFYAPKTHRVIPVTTDCIVLPPLFGQIADEICRLCEEYGVSAYDEKQHTGLLRHICIRQALSGVMVTLVVNASAFPKQKELAAACMRRFPQIRSFYLNSNQQQGNVILGKTCCLLAGDAAIFDTLCGLSFKISPLSFYQVNQQMATRLYQKAKQLLAPRPWENLLDLYCGTGTIGLTMAKEVGTLTGVEIVPQAIADAKENAARNGIQNASFLCADSAAILHEMRRSGKYYAAAIVDPPRKGLASSVIDDLSAMQPDRICYISCDPNTLARDLQRFAVKGYTAHTVYPYDMFSRTGHVETVVLLSRGEVDSKKIRVEFSLEDANTSGF